MGCDIHIFVEYKIDDTWYDGDYYMPTRDFSKTGRRYERMEIFPGRCYDLFGLLAGVRGNVKPIKSPKGLPKDCNKGIKIEAEKWDSDAHNHSWYTLRELIKCKKYQTIEHEGWVTDEDAKRIDNGEPHAEWVVYSSNGKFRNYREWKTKEYLLESIVTKLKERIKDIFYAWDDEGILDHADRIRIVFWFDN